MELYPGCPQLPTHILADGSAVGGVYFGFDSNTRKLLPLGEKAYSFWDFANHDLYCSKNSTDDYNGVGCTYWALRDICPDDVTKGYWECLP